jgi:hypothetical protein
MEFTQEEILRAELKTANERIKMLEDRLDKVYDRERALKRKLHEIIFEPDVSGLKYRFVPI